jgi:glutathione S-transferase
VVFESFALLEYLDEKYPTPPLMPSAPVDRARARAIALMGYLYVYPEARTIGMQIFDWEHWDPAKMPYPARRAADQVDRKVVEEAEKRLLGHLQILEAELARGPYQTGAMFGIADIVLVPAVAGFKLRGGPLHGFPKLSDWFERCMARPSVKDTATPVVKRGEPI